VLAFAVWRAGGVLVPVSTLYRPRELRHALESADVELLIAARAFLKHDYAAILDDAGRPPRLRDVVWLEAPASGAPVDLSALRGTPPPASSGAAPDDPATIIFTSGSTAEPKGAVHTQRALALAAVEDAAVLGVGSEDRTWGYLPFFFAGGLVAVALTTLTAGGTVVLQEVFDAGETLALLERERVTVFFAWPHQAEALLAHPRFGRPASDSTGVGANTKWAAALYPRPPRDQHDGTPPLCTAHPWNAPISALPRAGRRAGLRIADPNGPAPRRRRGGRDLRARPDRDARLHKHDEPGVFDADGFFHRRPWPAHERGRVAPPGRFSVINPAARTSPPRRSRPCS
jgi:hypothetical protein